MFLSLRYSSGSDSIFHMWKPLPVSEAAQLTVGKSGELPGGGHRLPNPETRSWLRVSYSRGMTMAQNRRPAAVCFGRPSKVSCQLVNLVFTGATL